MSLEQTIDNLQIRNANMVTFVGTSNTMVDTTTGRIQTKGIQHNSNVITDVSGPHGRIGPTLKKYPEIIFEEGKFDSNESTNTYVQAGYKVTVSGFVNTSNHPWKAFNGIDYEVGMLLSGLNYDTNGNANTTGTTASRLSASDSTPYGEWLKLELPNKIKLDKYVFTSRNHATHWAQGPEAGQVWGSNDDSNWEHVHTFANSGFTGASQTASFDVQTNNYYKYYAFIVTKTFAAGSDYYLCVPELKYYGYEEDPPAGDHSVDTTIKSRFNNPQTTGVQVLVDGATGVGTNQISGGPDPSGNQSTYVTDGKYWTLNGTLTSNLAVEANTFLEGDQPHAVSVWFNSSNLEANVSNTCVFSIASEEKLDSVNLDLQSNTWHNLTYTYQGEGGSRVTYLDGRKVAEDQAEDTFGDYPPFAMTGFSQGGYVVSVSSTHSNSTTDYLGWYAFNSSTTTGSALGWVSLDPVYTGSSYTAADPRNLGTDSGGAATVNGEYIILEMPHRLRVNYVKITHRNANTDRSPASGRFYGSNDGITWEEMKQFSGITAADYANGPVTISINSNKSYKRVALVPTGIPKTTADWVGIGNLEYYGHRENDLVRLPDPTNVLKYPHIKITNTTDADGLTYAIRGYEFSRSYDGETMANWYDEDTSNFTTFGPGNYNGSASGASGATTGTYNGSTNLGGTVGGVSGQIPNGEWHKIKMPHKILLSKLNIVPRIGQSISAPYEWRLYGSNDDSDWTLLYNKNDTSTIPDNASGADYPITTSTSFKYFAIVMIKSVNYAYLNVGEFNWYGTGVDSIPIQIGGGNIDKVANFRVYDKFVEEDQALEIWDAQKEEFGRAKPQMVLQQGKLGIGTDAPQGSLSVADEPHTVEEFPPRAMTGYKTYIEGHGEFCTSESNVYTSGYESYKAFNKNSTGTSANWWTQSDAGSVPSYSTSNGEFAGSTDPIYSTNVEGATKMGHWLQIEFPYKINYRYSDIEAPQHSIGRQPRAGHILGSNDLSGMWTSLHNFTNVTRTHAYESVRYTPPTVSTQTFKYFRLVIEEMNNYQYAGIARWDIFGTREQGQSVLHDGQLTLTKNLDVPRIGPPLDADDTPRRDRLVVEYNTSTNPTFEGAVRDTSGRGNDGVFVGAASYDANEKALNFTDHNKALVVARNNISGVSGDILATISLWFKMEDSPADAVGKVMFQIGNSNDAGKKINIFVYSNNVYVSMGGGSYVYAPNTTILQDKWTHVVAIKKGTGAVGDGTVDTAHSNDVFEIHIDGVKQSVTNWNGTDTLNIARENQIITVGAGSSAVATQTDHFDGFISTVKFWGGIVLTAQEVKTLYDMGRNGKIIPKTLQIDTPVQINAPLYAPKNVINITQSFYDGSMSTTSTTLQDVYTTEWIQMRKNSEVEVELSVLYRNDGNNWGGMYLLAFFMVDVPVGSVAANTWVAYLTPGYYMSYYNEIYEYGNTSYLPFKIPTDYKIRFKFQVRVYNNGTLYINRSHSLHFENSQFANLNQFIPMTTKEYQGGGTYYNGHTGGTKFIIKEIAG